MDAIKKFLDSLTDSLGDQVVNAIVTLIILLAGCMIAKWLKALTEKVLNKSKIDERLSKKIDGEAKIESIISSLVYFVAILFVLVVVLERLGMKEVLDPITNMIDDFIGALPHLIKAAILGFVAYIVAKVACAATTAITSPVDKYSEKVGLNKETKISTILGQIVFILIGVPLFIAALEALQIKVISDPATSMLQSIADYVPKLIGFGMIVAVGFVIAKVVSNAIASLATPVDSFSEKLGLSKDFKGSKIIGTLTFIAILVPTLIAALDTLQIDAISKPASAMLQQLLDAVPQILAASMILGVAFIVGRFATTLLADLLKSLGLDAVGEKCGTGEKSLSGFVGKVIFAFIMLTATVAAADKLGMDQVAVLVDTLLTFAAKIGFGLVIILAGHFLAQKIFDVLTQGKEVTMTAQIARGAIFALVLAMGLRSMGIADDIVNLAFGLVLGSVAVAFALSFGLGGREAAGKQAEYLLKKFRKED